MAEISFTILGKIGEYLAAPIGRKLGYIFSFKSNIETLTNEAEKLDEVKVGVQRRVDEGIRNVEDIDLTVQRWLNDVDAICEDAQKISQDEAEFPKGCFNHWCLNLKSHYNLSRSAKKKTMFIVELQKQGQTFEKVSCPAPPKPLIIDTSSSITLDSRESMLNVIMESLKNEEISMIGICGMGGVGKTTMIGEVFKKAKEDNLFDEHAKTVVSQKVDLTKIQSDIAEMLGLKLKEQSLEIRAGIDLKGSHKGCKILYTSRFQGLWIEFWSKRCELELEVLPYHEAWDLFQEKIGDFVYKNPEILLVAEAIVKECGGLPLSLVTLARALVGKSDYYWRDTLLKLNTTSTIERKIYESLRLSYDYLDNDEAKSLFLLCSLFKEDSLIKVQTLVDMGVGLQLFKGISSVAAARDRAFALLEDLHSRYLISISKYSDFRNNYIKVHDVVRDVSKSIASMEKGALVFEHGNKLESLQEEGVFEHCRWISIISSDIKELPTRLHCPKLELLICGHFLQVPDNCFEGTVKLQVVYMRFDDSQSPPPSLQFPTNLQTMDIRNYNSVEFLAIGNFESLKILCFSRSHFEELPKEIGKSTKLIVLDLAGCSGLKKISPGVISGLTNLEELYIQTEIDWETERNEERNSASLTEFKALSNLHTLHILIKDPRALPTTSLFGNLNKYLIVIGDFPKVFSESYWVYEDFFSNIVGYDKNLAISCWSL